MTNQEISEAVRDLVVATVTAALVNFKGNNTHVHFRVGSGPDMTHWCGMIIKGDVDVDVTALKTDRGSVDWTVANNYTSTRAAATAIIALLQT